MSLQEELQERLLAIAQELDFAQRYYALVAETSGSTPCDSLTADEIRAALESTGRTFRFNKRERFYATREAEAPGELGLNLTVSGVVEFILVVETPAGHVGQTFPGLARALLYRVGPPVAVDPRYPRVRYGDADELQRVLEGGFALYAELAEAISASGIVGKQARK
jgi:hypothetical protein